MFVSHTVVRFDSARAGRQRLPDLNLVERVADRLLERGDARRLAVSLLLKQSIQGRGPVLLGA